jgi:four helix bundle protein
MEAIRTFEDLECWKACRHLRLFVTRKVVSILPRDEKFELASQLRRAARSTTANIAEGYGRFHYRDNYKFCSNSRGSLFEVLDHLITANDDGYIDNELFAEGRALFDQARRILNGYMNYLRNAGSETAGLREDPISYNDSDELIPWLDLTP